MTRNTMHIKYINAIRQMAFLSLFAVMVTWGANAFAADYSNTIIENKSDQFGSIVTANAGTDDGSTTSLAEMIRQQRATLDAAANEEFGNKEANGGENGLSACDQALRSCMQEKCGKDFTKCAGDGDTDWGDKMESCKRKSKCNAHEYAMFTPEIKADRDMNVRLASYQKIIDCGNKYNSCIETECTPSFAKCLGKRHGDAAIAACEKIAKECMEQDSGLASRTMNVFATLRQDTEKQIKKDEQRLYELRDKMSSHCKRLGAMFDERSLVCVFTVEFWAGETNTLFASKKAYAGSSFDCNQEWFGIDITTFKENAFRYTRSTKSATSAFMGAGVGMAAGAISSGAIGRAMDRSKAQKALKKAEKEDKKADKDAEKEEKKAAKAEAKAEKEAAKAEKKAEKAEAKAQKKADKDAAKEEKKKQKEEKERKKEINKNNKTINKETKTSLSEKGDAKAQAKSVKKVSEATDNIERASGAAPASTIQAVEPKAKAPTANMDFGKIQPMEIK